MGDSSLDPQAPPTLPRAVMEVDELELGTNPTSNDVSGEGKKDAGTSRSKRKANEELEPLTKRKTIGDKEAQGGVSRYSEWEKNVLKNRYAERYNGQFVVVIQSRKPEGNVGGLRPMAIGKLIHGITSNVQEIKKVSRNKIEVTVGSRIDAHKIVENKLIRDKELIAFVPSYKVNKIGIIRGVDYDMTNEEIIMGAKCNVPIIKVERKTRRVVNAANREIQLVPTGTIAVTFQSDILPEHLVIWSVRRPVEPYVFQVKLCFKCLRYGHIQKFCKGSARCAGCAGEHETNKCDNEEIKCANCKKNHKATYKQCPEYLKQREVNEIIAQAGVSKQEAFARVNRSNPEYRGQAQESQFPRLQERNSVNYADDYIPSNRSQVDRETRAERKKTETRDKKSTSEKEIEFKKAYRDALVNPNGRAQNSIPNTSSHRNEESSPTSDQEGINKIGQKEVVMVLQSLVDIKM